MKEGQEEVAYARKRGREDTHEDDKPDQHKMSRANFFGSELSTFEFLDVEEDFVDDIDEERVYNLMKELMEEIGMLGHPRLYPPPEVDLALQCSAEIGYTSCDTASSSTNCSSIRVDGYDSAISTELESAKRVDDRADCGDYEGARIDSGEYYGEEIFFAGCVLGNDSCICNLDGTRTGDEQWGGDDIVRYGKSFNGEDDDPYEIEKWVLAIAPALRQANSVSQ